MLKVETKKGKMMIMASGDLQEITADIAKVISDLYGQLLKSDPGCAYAFRGAMIHVISDPNSPVWTDVDTDNFGIGITVPKDLLRKEGKDDA